MIPLEQELLEMQVQAKERVRELLKETHMIPRELIMLGRTLNCLRANNKQVGYHAANGVVVP